MTIEMTESELSFSTCATISGMHSQTKLLVAGPESRNLQFELIGDCCSCSFNAAHFRTLIDLCKSSKKALLQMGPTAPLRVALELFSGGHCDCYIANLSPCD